MKKSEGMDAKKQHIWESVRTDKNPSRIREQNRCRESESFGNLL